MNERARGAFLGLAVGDCLGAPVEGMPAWEIEKRFGRITEVLDPFEIWVRRPERGRLRGLHTDDTQQAWILADVLLKHKRIVPEEVAARYISFHRPRPDLPRGLHRGTGRLFRATVEALAFGSAPLEAGQETAGNGAAMRIAPLALMLAGQTEELARQVLTASLITHRDARALEAAAGLAALIAALIGDAPPSGVRGFVEAAIEGARAAEDLIAKGDPATLPAAARTHSGAFREVLAGLLVRADLDDTQLFREIANLAGAHSPGRKVKRASDGFALASVTAAIVIVARATDFRAALETAVNLGEDADTVGAMTGALAGARFGAAAIPATWLAALVGQDALSGVADALAGGTEPPPDQEPLEETWTRLEHAEGSRRAELADELEEDFDEDDEQVEGEQAAATPIDSEEPGHGADEEVDDTDDDEADFEEDDDEEDFDEDEDEDGDVLPAAPAPPAKPAKPAKKP